MIRLYDLKRVVDEAVRKHGPDRQIDLCLHGGDDLTSDRIMDWVDLKIEEDVEDGGVEKFLFFTCDIDE